MISAPDRSASSVDVVVVAYNSGRHLRRCVEPLARSRWIDVVVVDNASIDDSASEVEDLPVTVLRQTENLGFPRACNVGWRSTGNPYVLFLNPDAQVEPAGVARLASVLDDDPAVGVVGPRMLEPDGSTGYSQRRFPTLRSTFSQAFFLHRLFPASAWADEVIRDHRLYAEARDAEWLSGACLLVRRQTLERINGWDESFFLYSEDTEICRASWSSGYRVRYEPSTVVCHAGGASAPRSRLLALLASSRIAYARKNYALPIAVGHRVGIALEALTHMVVCRGGVAQRRGHARALLATLRPSRNRSVQQA